MIQTDTVGLSYCWKINNLHQTNKSRITWKKKSLRPWPCLTDDLWKKTGIIKLDDLHAVYIIQEKWNVKIKFLPACTKDRSQKNTFWNTPFKQEENKKKGLRENSLDQVLFNGQKSISSFTLLAALLTQRLSTWLPQLWDLTAACRTAAF